jgi:hypothetical protein
MNPGVGQRSAGAFLVIVPLAFTACFMLLQQLFEYPAILRQPTSEVLTKFAAGGAPLVTVWYALTLTAVCFIPLTLLVHRALFDRGNSAFLLVATTFGVLAGFAQALGFIRWPFLVPHLAQSYLAPGANEAQQAAATMVFEAFHLYAGTAVGEHLGYLTTSVWTVLVAVVMLRTAFVPRWLAGVGAVLGVGIAAGLAEPAGWELGGEINTYSYLLWAVWLVVVGVILLVRRTQPVPVSRPAALLVQPSAV